MATVLEAGASLFGAVHEDVRCVLRIEGVDDGAIRVASYDAREGLSKLFVYDVELGSDTADVAKLEDALGKEASFVIQREGATERIAHGILTEIIPDGAFVGTGQARTTVVLEPRLANLRYSGGFRIFQAKSVKDIIGDLVAPERIEVVFRLRGDLPVRDYRTQLEESDLEFLVRLAADEGLHFFFESDAKKTLLVFTNNPLGFPDLENDASFDFRDAAGLVAGEHVRSIRRARRVRTGAVEHRDYDFKNPHLELRARSETTDPQTEANTKRRELRDYPGDFLAPDAEGVPRARMRLEELRSDAATLEGTASTVRLLAGRAFTLTGHRDKGFNQKLVVTHVAFSGEAAGPGDFGVGRASSSLAAFEAIPADVPVRPARKKKPSSRLQIAKVVGPKTGDPFVDEFGRVKVQFYWDRDGKLDEHSSCWIRMMTPVAHGDEGFFSAHKVGSEVLVDFIDGDIDRPVILGALYNGAEKQPYKQPDEVTKSSWKVRSIPGGSGYNEITFENAAGKEQILTHAQHDRVAHVLHNDSETVGANQSISVGANQSTSVGANRSAAIGANDSTTIGGARTETVKKNESVEVDGARAHTVKGPTDDLYVTAGDRSVNVYVGNNTRNVKLLDKTEADNIEAHARYDAHLHGDRKIDIAQGAASCTMEGEHIVIQAPQHIVLDCPSGAAFLKDNKVTIQATDELVLQCGGSAISLKKDGTITIQAGKLLTAAVSNSSVKLEPAKAAIAGASVEVNAVGQAKIAGAIVKIN